jgi:hypothetical protein
VNGLRAPLPRLAAIYALSIPVALAVTPHGFQWEIVAALCAVMLVPLAGLAPWWLAINAVFLPAISAALTLELSPLWALGGLALLALFYGALWKSRVPLFFSSARMQQALAAILPPDRPIAFLDVGCGDGRVLARLAADRPDSRFDGIELAPGPWLLARMRCWSLQARCNVSRTDLWRRSLVSYDVVYAFLSPAVMERLWTKASREMRAGTLLVSAFGIPGVPADDTFDTGDLMGTQLHVWRMGADRKAPC